MKKLEIKRIIENFSQKTILIIGDVMVDSYLWGKVERISPEAPVPIISSTKRENRMGGAANVALNIQALGGKAILCSVIGKDNEAEIFLELMEKNFLKKDGIFLNKNRKTTVKTRIISHNQHLLRIDEEIDEYLNKYLEKKFFLKIKEILLKNKIDAVIFEDYDKGLITPFLIKKVVKIANENNIPILIDPKKRNFNYYKNITIFKPNFKELKEGLKMEIKKDDFKSIFKASQVLMKKNKHKYIMVTLSELGIFICDKNDYHQIPTKVRDVTDVSGAGDTVISVASLCISSGLNFIDTARISNLAGGLVCEKVGVVPINKLEILKKIMKQI
ncbi:MAG: D-glycero-beta-D-manno-heptose-7-phosphate kinase [Bacteroidetes bacterium 4572_128]|nr:MAG: D-glycero-beta-D-manno-heptose-7-phosphate kinase [Bacteroidetes bacterium 4572_128]